MKKKLLLLAVIICAGYVSLAQGGLPDLPWAKKVGARTAPDAKKIFWANDFGAVSDTITLNTKAIQAAINACAKAGGGIVALKPGAYVTGALYLKNNVNLRIDKGVILLGSQNFEDYPEIDTRIAGIEMKWPSALINVLGQQNVAITGEGKINARGKFCWDKYWSMRKNEYEPKGLRWIVDYDAKRIRTVLVQSSADVTIRGLTFSNAGFWTIQLLYSSHLTVDGVVIRNNEDGKGPSTDGVDIDSSSWVLVENCDIDCNDDNFCLKAGRDWDGLRVNRPTEYVVIRNSIARRGGGLLTLGSETSGGIRHVLAYNMRGYGTGNAFHVKSAVTRGGVVEDVYIYNFTVDTSKHVFHFNMNWNPSYSYSTLPEGYDPKSIPDHWKTMLQRVTPEERGWPTFRNIYISGIRARNAQKFMQTVGLEQRPITAFHLSDIEATAKTAGELKFISDWTIKNVKVITEDGTQIKELEGR